MGKIDVTLTGSATGDIVIIAGAPRENGLESYYAVEEFESYRLHLRIMTWGGLERVMALIMLRDFLLDYDVVTDFDPVIGALPEPTPDLISEEKPFKFATVVDPNHPWYGRQVEVAHLFSWKNGVPVKCCVPEDKINVDVLDPIQLQVNIPAEAN